MSIERAIPAAARGAEERARPLLLERFERLAHDHPGAPAVVCGDESLTYSELNSAAESVAAMLRKQGAGKGDCAGILLPPGIEWVAAMLGAWKVGAAYVPLDPNYPPQRLRVIIGAAKPACVISNSALADADFLADLATLCVPACGETMVSASAEPAAPSVGLHAHDLAYLMFTSGSTGLPNGVQVEHGNIAGLFADLQSELGFSPADRWFAMHSPAFGFSVWEMWGALSTGGCLVIAGQELRGDPRAWMKLLADESVSVLSITPSAFRQLRLAGLPQPAELDALRLIVFSGEAVREDDLAHWFAVFGSSGPLLVNTYALTETAGRVALQVYGPDQSPAPGCIGKPVHGAEIHVLSLEDGLPVKPGDAGELCVAGPMLARGYLDNPELTAERFVDFDPGDGRLRRIYRTGDRVIQDADGTLSFIGRIDDQVKLRGHRVELAEIEALLRRHPGVADVAVLLDESGPAPQLIAGIVPQDDSDAVEFWPSLGEYQVYDSLLYDFMSADDVRVASYRRAFERLARDAVVLDIGTGKDAILARLCAAAGARHVYAVEVLPDAAASARQLIGELGLSERITVLEGDMHEVVLPEAVTLCTQGIVGNIGSSDGIASIWNSARGLFAADAHAVPARCDTLFAPAELPEAARARPAFGPLAAAYAERVFATSGGPFDVRLCVRNFPQSGLLAEPTVFESLDFAHELATGYSGEAEFAARRDGCFDGFVLWTRLQMDATDTVDFLAHQQAWLPVWFPLADDSVRVRAGERIRARWQCSTPPGQIFPDYSVSVEFPDHAVGLPALTYVSRHFETAHNSTELHRRILAAGSGGHAALPDALRNLAAATLPAALVPGRWELLAQLPLNANGKLDRRALAGLLHDRAVEAADTVSADMGPAGEGSADPLQQSLADIWRRVLERPALGVDDDFFAAGGDSILAVRLTTEVQRYLDDTVFLAALFDAPTVRSYGQWLRANNTEAVARALAANSPPVATPAAASPEPVAGPLPLSSPQRSLWFLQQLYPDSPAANEQFLIRIEGPVDEQRLQAAWQALLAAHDILRSEFFVADGQALQRVLPVAECVTRVPSADLRALSPAEAEAHLRAAAERDIKQTFDLSAAPLLRPFLYSLPGDQSVLLVTAHHIIADGLCVPLIRDALATAWAGEYPRALVQYADFVQREQADAARGYATGLAWWRERLAGHDGQPLATGPGENPAVAEECRVAFELPAGLADGLREIAAAGGATLFMALLAAWRIWLQRCFGEADLLIGSPVTLRRNELTRDMLGCLVNNVVFRNPLTASGGFADALRAERAAALAAYDHSAVPFEQVVAELQPARLYGRHPLFQLLFMFEDRTAPGTSVGDLRFTADVLSVARTSYWDMEFSVTDSGPGRPMSAFIGARADLHAPADVATWPESFVSMLEALVADPHADWAGLPVLSAAQMRRYTVDWNMTDLPMPAHGTLHGLFAAQAARTPAAPAVRDENEALTYAELDARAGRYAAALAGYGVGTGTRVGLCLPRSAAAVALILAVLKRGAVWLPLDPAYPGARIAHMLDDARPALVVCGDAVASFAVPDGAMQVVTLRELDAADSSADEPGPGAAAAEVDAWILYTSGSTGMPRGSIATHAGAVNRCLWMWREFAFTAQDVFAHRTSLNFIDSVWEIFGALLHGASVEVLPPRIEHDAAAVLDWLNRSRITHLVTVPALLQALVDGAETDESVPQLRSVITSGEPLRTETAAGFFRRWPHCRLLNTYGTSETWDISCFELEPDDPEWRSGVPVGRPVGNTRMYILDGNLQPLPPGAVGELCASGPAVARGYLNQPELTRQRFVVSPFPADAGATLYRTGDLASYRASGLAMLSGRADRQIKLRGLRIEPADIERIAKEWQGISDCALLLRDAAGVNPWLALYCVAEELDAPALRSWLQQRLPRAMVPADIIRVNALPRTPSGKLDRLALPLGDAPAPSVYVAPRTETERRLAAIWAAALEIERVGVDDDFFALRGHSLLATRVTARICDVFGIELPLQCIFEAPTVASLARSVDALCWARSAAAGRASDDADPESNREVLRL